MSVSWSQEAELTFIAGLGKHGLHNVHAPPPNYAERMVRGYIASLNLRRRWFAYVDMYALRRAAERRLAQVTGH